MAVVTMTHVGAGNRCIGGGTRIVTGQTGGFAGNMTKGHVIDMQVRSQQLVRVAIQTIGRIGTSCDAVNDFLTRTVVTSGTGTDTVGINIVDGPFNAGPIGRRMTLTTETTWRLVGEITRTDCDGMPMSDVVGIKAAGMAGRTVAGAGLPEGQTDPITGCGVVTAGTGSVRINRGTDQSVVVTVSTAGGTNLNQSAVVGDGVQAVPVAGMTSRTVATSKEGFIKRKALEAAVSIVTAGTSSVGVGCAAEQSVIVTAGTAGRCNLNQIAVVRGVGGMGGFPTAGMTAGTIAAAGRQTRLQVRNIGMTVTTHTLVSAGDGCVSSAARIVTSHTRRQVGDMIETDVIDT